MTATVKQDRRYELIRRIDAGSGPGKLELGTAGFSTTLASIELDDVSCVVAGSVIKVAGLPKTGTGLANGTPAAARVVDSDDNIVISTISVTLDVSAITSGGTFNVLSASVDIDSLPWSAKADSMPIVLIDPVTGDPYKAAGAGADATAANQALQIAQETAINSALGTAVASPAANTVLDRLKSLLSITGAVDETAPASDTASSGLNGRLQRVSQRLTSLIGYFLPITTATISSVSASATSVTLLASNSNRRRITIVNDSTSTLYIKFGATASATSYTYFLAAGDTYESPALDKYTGIIDGIWVSANGAARITEYV